MRTEPSLSTLDRQATEQNLISIEVTPRYLEEASEPSIMRYVFSYTVTIRNNGPISARLLKRHWFITDGFGNTQQVSGEGVIGEQPLLKPGEDYVYTSGAIITTPVGYMHGCYELINKNGVLFDADIPGFSLFDPTALH